MELKNHTEVYQITLEAAETIEIKVNGTIVYSKETPADMNAEIEFKNTEYKITVQP